MNWMIRVFFAASISAIMPLAAYGDTPQEKFWTSYIEACSPSTLLNGSAHYLGTTNQIGPGSVWGLSGGTTNLVATADQYLGKPDVNGKLPSVVYAQSSVVCGDGGSKKYDLSFGVPFSFTGGTADISLALKNAKSITVTIKSIQVDTVPAALWSMAAAQNVSHSSPVYTMAVDGHHMLMSAAVAITGMTITYSLDSSLSATVQAQIAAGNAVNIGTTDNPVKASLNVSNDGQTVTLTAVDRTYVLGQFLKIDKIKPTQQQSEFDPVVTPGVKPKAGSYPPVKASAPVRATASTI